MPPFSGKKKKEQLQAKRQRKREAQSRQDETDRLEDRLREQLLREGQDVTPEAIAERMAALRSERGGADDDGGRPHGRKEHRRARQQQQQQRGAGGTRSASAPSDGTRSDDSSDDSSQDDGADRRGQDRSRTKTRDQDEGEYMYDAHGHGVRSTFRKETKAELDARRRLNFMPLANREFMDAKVGIPFGRWFLMPRRHEDGPTTGPAHGSVPRDAGATVDDHAQPTAGNTAAAVAPKPLVSDDGMGSSLCFPLALEIPSRGWAMRGESESADAIQMLSNETVRSRPCDGAQRSGEPASRNPTVDDSEECAELPEPRAGRGKKPAPLHHVDPSRALTAELQRIEEDRFRTYLDVVESYDLPDHFSGLTMSSCERNLDVWRQLWRAVDASDVAVLVIDARYPAVHIHLGLLHYLTRHVCLPCVLVLNKTDLVPRSVLECWLTFITLYLTSHGLLVMSADAASALMRASPPAQLRRDGRASPIVLHTFTANPSRETAQWMDEEVDVRRRRGARERRARMYEQLRSGQLNVAKHMDRAGGGEAAESASPSDDEDAYGASVNFKGQAKAERNLQAGRREFNELKIVSEMITQLLATCRALGPDDKGLARQTEPAAAPTARTGGSGDGGSRERGSTAKPTAPVRRGNKGRRGKRGERLSAGSSEGEGSGAARRRGGDNNNNNNSSSGSSSDEDVLDEREDDDASFLHISFIGYPNVGKSSLLNCIRGTKVVSVSATPGHTRHVQTIPIPAEGVTLVDSPGLVFPYYGLPRPLEAVLGTHQIAQTRDPQSGVAFLASHLPLERIYGLRRPEDADAAEEWSAYELCEAYAKKRGYFVKHGKGALDVHRAAIAILQEAYQGRLTLYFAPPERNYLQSTQYLECVKPHLLLPVFAAAEAV